MKNKDLWINIGISAGVYFVWLAITFLLASVDAIADFCLLFTAPLFIAGCAYMVYRSGRLMLFPLTTITVHVIVCIIAVISFSADLDKAVNSSDGTGADVIIDLFVILGSTFIYAVLIAAAVIGSLIILGVSVLTGVITRKVLKSKSV